MSTVLYWNAGVHGSACKPHVSCHRSTIFSCDDRNGKYSDWFEWYNQAYSYNCSYTMQLLLYLGYFA